MKRMIPKDSVSKVGDTVQLKIVNVLSAIDIQEMPENIMEYINADLDGVPISKDILSKVTIEYEGETFPISDSKSYSGKTIKIGGILLINVPGLDVQKGEEHELEIKLKEEERFNFKLKRVIQ